MKRRFLCISILAVGVFLSAESGFYAYLQPGIDIFELSISEPMVVSFGNFTYADKKIGSSFSKYLETQLCLALGKSDRFKLFAKDQLEDILEALELSLSDLSDSAQSPKLGKLKAIQGLISGRFFDTDDTVQFSDIEKSFENLGITSNSMVKRGLIVTKEKAQTTELMSSYTILAD